MIQVKICQTLLTQFIKEYLAGIPKLRSKGKELSTVGFWKRGVENGDQRSVGVRGGREVEVGALCLPCQGTQYLAIPQPTNYTSIRQNISLLITSHLNQIKGTPTMTSHYKLQKCGNTGMPECRNVTKLHQFFPIHLILPRFTTSSTLPLPDTI